MQPPAATQFADVLRGALALPPDDQERLCALLQRLTTGASASVPDCASASAPGCAVHADGDPLCGAHLPQDETLASWLAQLERAPAWTQLALLDEALADLDCEEDACVLRAARAQLLQAHPAVAVRYAVVELASRHPVAVALGVLGLALAGSGLARGLLRVVF